MRIVYYTPPSTPAAYFWLMLKATGLAYVGLTLLFFLFSLLSGTGYSNVFLFFHEIFAPVTQPVFAAAGLHELAVGESGLYTFYLLLQVPGLLNTIPMMRLKLEQLRQMDEDFGPVRKREHLFWFYAAFVFAFCFMAMRYAPPFEATGLMKAVSDCLRILFTLGFALAAVCFTVIGFRLRSSWLKSPEAVKLPDNKSAKRNKSRANIKVAIDNTKPAPAAVAPAAPISLSDSNTGIYVAMTTEMIQAAGRTGEAPTSTALLATLEMLQKAAIITRSGHYSHHDLKGLCERACNLFIQGQLTHMPDMKAAQALYKKPDPNRLTAIAAELKALLETPEAP